MADNNSKSPAFFAALALALGLVIAGCSEEGGDPNGAPAEEGMTMDDAEDQIKDGIDPETGNPPEL